MKKIISISILLGLFSSTSFAKGEVTKIYAQYKNATKSSYRVGHQTYRWGRGKDLIIDGFEYNNKHYKYTTMADKVVIRRVDNKQTSGKPCGLFAETTGNDYNMQGTYPTGCDMAKVMGGRVINIGVLDLFKNTSSDSGKDFDDSAKNIERVDFITTTGIKAPKNIKDLPKAGHVITEKSGNNPIQIAAILELDANGNPSRYGPLVMVHGGGDYDFGISTIYLPDGSTIKEQSLAVLRNEQKGPQGNPWNIGHFDEPLGMSFVSLDDLGVGAGDTYYGFSYFDRGVASDTDLVDYKNFPLTTNQDTADPYGGVAGYFVDEEISDDIVTPFTCQSKSFVSFNTAQYATTGDSKYNTFSLANGELTAEETISGINGVNSIGYNIKDNMVWGWNLDKQKVIRIDANKKVTLYDIEGLDKRFYVAADVSPEGILYLFSRGNSSERSNLARVDLGKLKSLPEVPLKDSHGNKKEINTADIAFNPKDGNLYFIQKNTDDLYKITFSKHGLFAGIFNLGSSKIVGTVTKVTDIFDNKENIDPIINFFDKDGNFYFNYDSKNMYKINVMDAKKASWFSKLNKNLSNGDGARCALASVIKPDDQPLITINNAQVIEGDSGIKNISFTITSNIDIEYAEGLKLDYTLSDGSAKEGSDFKASSSSFFMLNKSYTLNLPIIKGDTEVEGNEEFTIHFTAPISKESASFTSSTATGTIIDNDKPKGRCFATTDNHDKLFIYDDLDEKDGLANPKVINLNGKVLRAEGGAYRALDGYIYVFDDVKNSNRYDLKKVDIKTGEITTAKKGILKNGFWGWTSGHIDSAEFYYDEVSKTDLLYATDKHASIFYIIDTSNWNVIKKKDIEDSDGNEVKIGALAINPYNKKIYGVRDAGGYDGSTDDNPILYSLDITGSDVIATKLFELPHVDAEGLAFANDGQIYLETEELGHGDEEHKIYRLNLLDGSITKVAHTGTKGLTPIDEEENEYVDIETLSCDGGLNQVPPILSVVTNNMTVKEGNPSSKDTPKELSDKDINITIKSNRPIREGEIIKIKAQAINGTAMLNSDFVQFGDSVQMKVGEDSLTLSQPLVQKDFLTEKDEYFTCEFSVDGNYGTFQKDKNSLKIIIEDDDTNNIFDAWNKNDGNITTQVVKKSFKLKIGLKNTLLGAVDKFDGSELKMRLVEPSNGKCKISQNSLTNWTAVEYTSFGEESPEFNVIKASKNARVQFFWKNSDNEYVSSCSTDAFAIRPDKFTMTIPTKIKAGENFSLNLKAVGVNGNPTNSYNEVIDNSFDITYTEKKPLHCTAGTIDLSGITFSNGVVNKDINYSEVGMLDFNISEVEGLEFALIDKDDTDDINRYITPASTTDIKFIPNSFEISNLSLKNGAKDFTYYANHTDMDKMSAELNVTIKALNASGALVKNYNGACYAKNTSVTITYTIDGDISSKLVWLDPSNHHSDKGDSNKFVFDINRTRFLDGETKPLIYLNFDRKTNVAKEPLRLNLTGLNATDSDVSGTKDLSTDIKSADFYYGRMHVPNYYGIEKEHDIEVFHEVYCNSCNRNLFKYTKGKESEDNIHWYILDKAQYDGGGKFDNLKNSDNSFIDKTDPTQVYSSTSNTMDSNGVDLIKLHIPKAPLRERFTYEPNSWLIFNKFNASSDKQSFQINISSSSGWAGKGEKGLSTKGSSSKRYNHKMDW